MIIDELSQKINHIKDLPFSAEMLGAYIEDNLSFNEMSDIQTTIQNNDYLRALLESCGDEECDATSDIDDGCFIEDFDLPILPEDKFIELDLEYTSSFPETEDLNYVASCATDMDDYNSNDSIYDSDTFPYHEDGDYFSDFSDSNDEIDYE